MPMKLAEALKKAEEALACAGVEEARLKAELLMGHLIGCSRLSVVLHANEELSADRAARWDERVRRAAAREPVQYVLGEADFMGRLFKVDRRVLVPRPETEVLVENVLAEKALWLEPKPVVADIGTGSGCIAVTLALERPRAEIVAVDISGDALALAAENAARLGAADRVRFVRGDLLSGLSPASLDAVVSNPPYVGTTEWGSLAPEIRDFEPRVALEGGEDGLAVISRLVPQARRGLKSGGVLFLEIGDGQGESVYGLMKESGFADIEVRQDLAGRERIVRGRTC